MKKRLSATIFCALALAVLAGWAIFCNAGTIYYIVGLRPGTLAAEVNQLAIENTRLAPSLNLSNSDICHLIRTAVATTEKEGISASDSQTWLQTKQIALSTAQRGLLPNNCSLNITTYQGNHTYHNRLDLTIDLPARKGWTLPLKELD